jgi:AcrR family transcriptional regulator
MPRARKTAANARKTVPPKKAPRDDDAALFQALFDLVAKHGWFDLTLRDVARAAKLTLPQLMRRYPSKNALLEGFNAFLDRRLINQFQDEEAPLKERLFDLLMQRFDALQPYRAGLCRFMEDLPRHPLEAACLGLESGMSLCRSMAMILELAGVPAGKSGIIPAAAGLHMVYLVTLYTWKKDDSADMSATMAALDRQLDRFCRMS